MLISWAMPQPAPIYLDNAATTRPLPAVAQAMQEIALQAFGNPSSAHDFALAPRKALADAREFLRGSLGAGEVIFTAGGTESDLLGVTGAAMPRPPGRVLAAASDHPAILAQTDILARSQHRLVQVPVTEDGDILPETLFDLLGQDVRVVSLLHGHNELGTLCQLEELVSLVRQVAPNAHIHVDLVQSYGKIPFHMEDIEVDSVAVAGHKLHGPRGIGLLALSNTARLQALQAGGGQEQGLRGGTENVAGAVGLAVAAENALSDMAHTSAHTESLAAEMFTLIQEAFPQAQRLGHPERRLPHILSLQLPNINAASLMEAMNAQGVAFSTGAACHGPEESENHVLKAIGLDRRAARSVMRFSFCKTNTIEEVEQATSLLINQAQHLQKVAPKTPSKKPGKKPRVRRS